MDAEQLPLFPIQTATEIVIVPRQKASDAWNWLCATISPRPSPANQRCLYDCKLWDNGGTQQPLHPATYVGELLGRLYLTSQLGDLESILSMANGCEAQDVIVPAGSLDKDVEGVVKSKSRFRAALSEHLAFWIRLATAAQAQTCSDRFACALPNVQPEDKGPDGLFLSTGPASQVEIQSVKNSINDPQSLVSTKRFRTNGRVSSKHGKLLEDFYRFAHSHVGFVRLDRLLTDLCRLLDIPSDRKIRMALLSSTVCAYNAVVVADHQYEKADLFQGYEHITQDVQHRIATYIGSTSWSEVAEVTRKSVCQVLQNLGIL
jgi:hypothetical protein